MDKGLVSEIWPSARSRGDESVKGPSARSRGNESMKGPAPIKGGPK